MSIEEPSADSREVPACKGCGSRNLRAVSQAMVYTEYDEPTRVELRELHFRSSFVGYGQGERWRIHCADCGRGMRTKLVPVNDD